MKTVICYYSRHHGNTLKIAQAMADALGADLFDVTSRMAPRLDQYDCVGFASGIYYGKFHPTVGAFARQYLPRGRAAFLLATCGSPRKGYTKSIRAALAEKDARVLGEFLCRGWDTFGPFRLIGGLAKGRPNESDLARAAAFARETAAAYAET